MRIYVTNEKEREMLNAFMVHVLHDLESVKELYSMDDIGEEEMYNIIKNVRIFCDNIIVDESIQDDVKPIVDFLMGKGLSNKEIGEITGLSELTVKRCRMRVKQ